MNSAHTFFMFALFSAFQHNKQMFHEFGFHNEMPTLIGYFLYGEVLMPCECVIQLLTNMTSRLFEYQAGKDNHSVSIALTDNDLDSFALDLGYKAELAQALIKLQIKNLSSMDADHLYSSYHYSHPILTERLGALGWKGEEKVSEKPKSEKEL
jgi:STE24 endopeptidase